MTWHWSFWGLSGGPKVQRLLEDDFMDIQLVDHGIAEDLLNRVKSIMEEILAELFETSTSEGSVEVNTLK